MADQSLQDTRLGTRYIMAPRNDDDARWKTPHNSPCTDGSSKASDEDTSALRIINQAGSTHGALSAFPSEFRDPLHVISRNDNPRAFGSLCPSRLGSGAVTSVRDQVQAPKYSPRTQSLIDQLCSLQLDSPSLNHVTTARSGNLVLDEKSLAQQRLQGRLPEAFRADDDGTACNDGPSWSRPTHIRRPSHLLPIIHETQANTSDESDKSSLTQPSPSTPQEDVGTRQLPWQIPMTSIVPSNATALNTPAPGAAGPRDMFLAAKLRAFRPMDAIQLHHGQQPFLRRQMDPFADSSLFSAGYHGMHCRANASADHINDSQNCALWLTNLHPRTTYHELLSKITKVGRIWCTYINEPDHFRHHTAAAKVVFFSPEAAKRLLTVAWFHGIVICDYRIHVSHNRIKYERQSPDTKASRVLIITGKSSFVNEESLTEYFTCLFMFQKDVFKELIKAGERAVVEYRFGSYRCQAQMGKMALERDQPPGFEKVEYGDDPCEHGETYASYGIAAERIRGWGI